MNDYTGAIDLVIDENNPEILYASMWEKDRKAWNFDGSGIGSGIYKSIDGGENWVEISGGESGFPDTEGTGRIGLDISRSNSNILFAILDNQDRREGSNNAENDDLTKDDLRSISTSDFLKIEDKKIRDFLRNNLSLKKNQIAFFALSSFGVFSKNDPRPNRLNIGRNLQDGAIIDNGELWRPFGLVNPLYWIATGKKWKDPSF